MCFCSKKGRALCHPPPLTLFQVNFQFCVKSPLALQPANPNSASEQRLSGEKKEVLFLVLSLCLQVDARSKTQPKEQQSFAISQESILRSIDNDFDCVDINKQPALRHPLLKNHKIQLNPTFARKTVQSKPSYTGKDFKVCPSGKVPIHKMTKRHQIIGSLSSKLQIEGIYQYDQSCPGYHTKPQNGGIHQYDQSHHGYHYATLETTKNMTFHGANAIIGTYNLSLQGNQSSLSQVWLQSGQSTELNSIQVGTGVYPCLYGDSQLHITAYWTADGYNKTGCFNTLCPGFVQVDQNLALGAVISHLTPIGALDKYVLPTKIQQDQATGHWWLALGPNLEQVGYWPKEIFTSLNMGSSIVKYGGETFTPPNMVSPPMGSGRLPEEFFRNSGFIGRLEIVGAEYNVIQVRPEDMKSYCDTSSYCYDLLYKGYEGPQYRQAFLYGGPGGQCGM